MKKFAVFVMAALLTVAFAGMSHAFKKDVTFAVKADEGKVTFSHEVHTETNKLKCTECHDAIFKKKAGGTEDVTMASMDAGKNCGACHNGEKAFSTKDEKDCGKCHVK